MILEKNLSLRQPRELLHCLRNKKKLLIFHNKYHKCSAFYHCIIHQGTFCSKLSHLSHMLSVRTQQDEFSTGKCYFYPEIFKFYCRNLMQPWVSIFYKNLWHVSERRESQNVPQDRSKYWRVRVQTITSIHNEIFYWISKILCERPICKIAFGQLNHTNSSVTEQHAFFEVHEFLGSYVFIRKTKRMSYIFPLLTCSLSHRII